MADVELDIRSQNGAKVDRLTVPAEALGGRVRPTLIHRAVVAYAASKRAGTASTKARGEINRSNRKPWPQKGTGRARAGTRRSPLWRGGGIIFGPKPRDYGVKLNKKQRRLALRSSLLGKVKDGELVVVESLELERPKTKLMVEVLRSLDIDGSCLLGMKNVPENVLLACRNLPGVKVLPAREFNAYEVLRHRYVLMTRDGMDELLGLSTAEASSGGEGKEETDATEDKE